MTLQPRLGEAPPKLDRQAFAERFRERFADPAYRAEDAAIARLEEQDGVEPAIPMLLR
ncbi:hypothetical protein [Pseudomonas sp. A6]|uniref:hypothetical protein n=1 Tax=Pseudomonas sp. A6 TaxID=410021 RepID=UPI004024FA91